MKQTLILLIFFLFYSFVNADVVDHYDRVNISSAAEQQVDNDLITMVLVVNSNSHKTDVVAKYINETMAWAIEKVKKYKDIILTTENYKINAIYKKHKFIGWRGSQNLVLRSTNVQAMSKVTSILLKELQVQSQQYSLSFNKKEQIENMLIKKALSSLKKRANIVQNSFGSKSYRLVRINVNTQSSSPVHLHLAKNRRYEKAELSISDALTPVANESGQSTVKVMINGEIELVK